MKVALYLRVSTTEQSTEMQRSELLEYVKNHNLEVFETYEDVISGSISSRPELNRLMSDASKRKFKAIIVWKFDRFARSLKHLVSALEELSEKKVEFISIKENVDTTTSVGKAMFGMIAVMAQLERDMIRERVKSGLRHAKSKGIKLGRPSVVRTEMIKALAKDGTRTLREIASELGISHSSVSRILKAG